MVRKPGHVRSVLFGNLPARAADIPWRMFMAKLRGLRKEELVESPEKGKYVISD